MTKRTQNDDESNGVDDATAVVSAQLGAPLPSGFSDETVIGASPPQSVAGRPLPEASGVVDEATRVVRGKTVTRVSEDTIVSRSSKQTSTTGSSEVFQDNGVIGGVDEGTVVVRGKRPIESAEATVVSRLDNGNWVSDDGNGGDSTIVVRRGNAHPAIDDSTYIQRRGENPTEVDEATFVSGHDDNPDMADEATITGSTGLTAPSAQRPTGIVNRGGSRQLWEEPEVDRGRIDALNPSTANQAAKVQSVRKAQTHARADINLANLVDHSANHKTQRTSQEVWEINERRRKQAKNGLWVMIFSMIALGASAGVLLTLLLR
jgi:hypothetical protein